MLIGYARVSTTDQDPRAQLDALAGAGCGMIFQERRSALRHRPELVRLLYCLRAGDEVAVWKTDRLARSLLDLLAVLARVERSGARFRSLTEPIDTGTPVGRMLVQLLGSFAEFERNVIRERCAAGRAAAAARGVHLGRPRSVDRLRLAEALAAGCSQSEAARLVGCAPSSVCHLVRSGALAGLCGVDGGDRRTLP